MNRALLIACFAMSAIALALSLVPRDAPPPAPVAAGGGVTMDDVDILERRLDALEDANRDLLNRLVQLQRGQAAAGSMGFPADAGVSAAVQAELVQLRNEVHGMVAGEALHSEGGKQWLKETLRELEAEDRRERTQQQLARAAARSEEQKAEWKKFITDAHLNYAQEQTLTKALDAESARRKALMDEVAAGTKDFRDVMRETRDVRRETDKTVKAGLDEAQSKQYEQLRREQNRPRGDWGGGGDGQRGGGGQRERRE